MNGAMAELCARISSSAKTPSVIRIGVIHQRLLLQKKANSSPAIPKRWPVVFKKPMNISCSQKSGEKVKCNSVSKKPEIRGTLTSQNGHGSDVDPTGQISQRLGLPPMASTNHRSRDR